VRFAPVFSTAIAIELRVEGPLTSLCLEERMDLGPARDMVLISLMFGLQTIGSALTAREQQGAAEFAFPEPAYYPRFRHLSPNARFGQPVSRMVFNSETLDSPIVSADATGLSLARSLCERQLEELGFDAELVDRVRRVVAEAEGGFRSLEEVASLIHLSTPTLKRKLAAQGASFSSLVERERRDRALVLLRSSRLSIEDVAERLDYANGSTFVRAFHRWTGTTPAAYRRSKKGRVAAGNG